MAGIAALLMCLQFGRHRIADCDKKYEFLEALGAGADSGEGEVGTSREPLAGSLEALGAGADSGEGEVGTSREPLAGPDP